MTEKVRVTLGNTAGINNISVVSISTLPDGYGQEGSKDSEKAEELNNYS